MQFSKIAAAAALFAPALASTVNLQRRMEYAHLGTATVHNKCSYTVYLWSVFRGIGCDQGVMKTLYPGQTYSEQYTYDQSNRGVSIKISKTQECKNVDITQLEYFINPDPAYPENFLDCSFVDCPGNSCPGRDAFHLRSGNIGGQFQTAGLDKKICPVDSCNSQDACSKIAYILPDDVQTRSCDPAADLDFYLCTDSDQGSAPAPEPEEPAPSSAAPTPSKQSEIQNVQVANVEVTPAPVAEPKKKVHTKVVTVTQTAYEYAYAKRGEHVHHHAHRNAHRHA